MRRVCIGVDGGGTKTEAAVGCGGEVLGRGFSGPSNPNDVGAEAALAAVSSACSAALEAARVKPGEDAGISSVCAGIAGALSHIDELTAGLRKMFPLAAVSVVSDADLAVAAGLDGDGAVLIAGTGSVLFACKGCERRRIGGWGWLLDGAGGGYDLGRDALTLCLRGGDGRGRYLEPRVDTSALRSALTAKLGGAPEEKIGAIYAGSKAYIASLAPAVLETARSGDQAAEAIVARSAAELAAYVCAARDYLGAPFRLVMAGGLLTREKLMRDALLARLPDGVSAQVLSEPPVAGALKLAARLAGENGI